MVMAMTQKTGRIQCLCNYFTWACLPGPAWAWTCLGFRVKSQGHGMQKHNCRQHPMEFHLYLYFYSASVGERSIVISLSVCVSVSISLEPLDRSSRNFVCRSPVAVAWSSSGGVAILYVLAVLWMTSHLAVMGRMTIPGRSLMSVNALLVHVLLMLFYYVLGW